MMRALLDACRLAGEPVAYLWATEDTIYSRFGFGLASFSAEIDVPRGAIGIPLGALPLLAMSGSFRLPQPNETSRRYTKRSPR